MLSIRNILLKRNQPYQLPLKVAVVKKATNSVTNKEEMAIADLTGCAKCLIETTAQNAKLIVGRTFIIRNFGMGRYSLYLKANSTISQCVDLAVPEEIIEEARTLVQQEIPERMTIQELRDTKYAGLTTVSGVIIKDEAPKEVGVHRLIVRNMTMKDETGEIEVALWREIATAGNFRTGDRITLTFLQTKKDRNETKLSSTNRTTIEVEIGQEELKHIKMLGLDSEEENTYAILCEIDGEFITQVIQKNTLNAILNIPEGQTVVEAIDGATDMDVFIRGNEILRIGGAMEI